MSPPSLALPPAPAACTYRHLQQEQHSPKPCTTHAHAHSYAAVEASLRLLRAQLRQAEADLRTLHRAAFLAQQDPLALARHLLALPRQHLRVGAGLPTCRVIRAIPPIELTRYRSAPQRDAGTEEQQEEGEQEPQLPAPLYLFPPPRCIALAAVRRAEAHFMKPPDAHEGQGGEVRLADLASSDVPKPKPPGLTPKALEAYMARFAERRAAGGAEAGSLAPLLAVGLEGRGAGGRTSLAATTPATPAPLPPPTPPPPAIPASTEEPSKVQARPLPPWSEEEERLLRLLLDRSSKAEPLDPARAATLAEGMGTRTGPEVWERLCWMREQGTLYPVVAAEKRVRKRTRRRPGDAPVIRGSGVQYIAPPAHAEQPVPPPLLPAGPRTGPGPGAQAFPARPRVPALEDHTAEPVHHGFTCDGCSIDPIVGVRWRCAQCEPDVELDLCAECMEGRSRRPFASAPRHAIGHGFRAIALPEVYWAADLGGTGDATAAAPGGASPAPPPHALHEFAYLLS